MRSGSDHSVPRSVKAANAACDFIICADSTADGAVPCQTHAHFINKRSVQRCGSGLISHWDLAGESLTLCHRADTVYHARTEPYETQLNHERVWRRLTTPRMSHFLEIPQLCPSERLMSEMIKMHPWLVKQFLQMHLLIKDRAEQTGSRYKPAAAIRPLPGRHRRNECLL